ncbi:hypothetical protein ACFWXH_27010 [Mesorhizobium sp. NPDC059054]|uniref:hypothetical protein n=1 Tax=Mesorhizobium sp. NPDC059054 TaxID=3346711 RepID=UPI00369310A8
MHLAELNPVTFARWIAHTADAPLFDKPAQRSRGTWLGQSLCAKQFRPMVARKNYLLCDFQARQPGCKNMRAHFSGSCPFSVLDRISTATLYPRDLGAAPMIRF